jgi:hypothetical protein
MLTPFFGKTGQKRDKEKQPMKIERNRPIEEREGGQQDLPIVRRIQS